ncbi:hypothetical protein PR202_gb14753 [Eleusine coracana subsp. coracana]|uniref:Thioesterase domain-containing protein n=1 Tax=Eleusine coracana subsp. coracana TaxID=191504 RepID=A0AAV5EW27_ELECO|nr:hypothetical protein QOZ80_4BG0339110 [Eleusine coracana subsp. coracana]GJN26793.1 hypothetical protein PR202_gb14753 [Eleusine coracana subsp. coracana]
MSSLLSPSVTGLSSLLRATDGRTFGSDRCDRVVLTITGRGQEHLGGGAAHLVAVARPFLSHCAATCNPGSRFHQGAQATNALNQLTTTRKELEDKVFEVEMQVHNDDLDAYGVVNNAIYASYINRARDVLLEYLGIGVEYWASTGNAMAISELNLKYFAPLRIGDRFVVKVWPEKIKGTRLVIRHLIEALPDGKLVLDARATIVFLNKDYRPTRVFPEVAAKAWEMFGCKEG